MNQALGKVVTAVMIDENDQDYFVQPDRNGRPTVSPRMKPPRSSTLADRSPASFMKTTSTSSR